jgi:CspA family cold shock protein
MAIRSIVEHPRVVEGSSRTGRASADSRVREENRGHMSSGTVKKLVADRGFGFITADDGKDYFFHRGALEGGLDFDRLVGGEKVDFEVEASPKGPRAVKVRAA